MSYSITCKAFFHSAFNEINFDTCNIVWLSSLQQVQNFSRPRQRSRINSKITCCYEYSVFVPNIVTLSKMNTVGWNASEKRKSVMKWEGYVRTDFVPSKTLSQHLAWGDRGKILKTATRTVLLGALNLKRKNPALCCDTHTSMHHILTHSYMHL
jgi:hypothetical protein